MSRRQALFLFAPAQQPVGMLHILGAADLGKDDTGEPEPYDRPQFLGPAQSSSGLTRTNRAIHPACSADAAARATASATCARAASLPAAVTVKVVPSTSLRLCLR